MGLMRTWQRFMRWLGLAVEKTPLDRAHELLQQGFVEEAIFVCRDVLYGTLVNLARAAQVATPAGDQDERAYALNDALAQMGVYAEPMRRQIQQWLHMGQLALQGAIDEFTIGDAQQMIDNLGSFVRVVTVTLDAAQATARFAPASLGANGATPPPVQPPPPRPSPQPPPRQQMPPPQPRPRQLTAPGVPLFYEGGQAPTVLGTMPRIPGFVGRGHIVMRLSSLLRQGRHVALVPLDAGTAGIGLSAVASETLWLLEQDSPPAFGDGILALNCFGRQGEEALRWIYNEIGLTWRVPVIAQSGALNEQEREVRRVLMGRQVLLVLDGVEMGLPAARLLDMLASCGATVLITSRYVPRAEQLSVLRLDPLGGAPALTLLQERFAAAGGVANDGEEDAGRLICETLDFRPLAIELAAAIAATLSLPFPTLAQRLQSARARGLLTSASDANQSIRYLVDLIVQTFDVPTLNRFLALAILAGPTWSEEAALAVMSAIETPADLTQNVPVPSSAATLRDLVRRGVVQSITSAISASRYRLQPFIRTMAARSLLDRSVVMGWAGHAMASHYAGLALRLRRASQQDALREEYVHMEAGLQWAHAHTEHELEVAYGMGLYRFWQKEGLWQEALRYLGWAARAAHEIGDRPREAALAQELATIETDVGHAGRAREWYERSLEIWRGLGNGRNEAAALFELGRLAQEEGESENARAYYDASLRAATDAQDEQGMARALQALGLIFEARGEIEEARRCYEMVFEMRQNAHDPVGMAGALNVLGVLEYHQGRFPAAQDLLTASLNNAIDAGNLFWQAEAHFWLGETALALRDFRAAADQWQHALAFYIRQGRATDAEETQRRLTRLASSDPRGAPRPPGGRG